MTKWQLINRVARSKSAVKRRNRIARRITLGNYTLCSISDSIIRRSRKWLTFWPRFYWREPCRDGGGANLSVCSMCVFPTRARPLTCTNPRVCTLRISVNFTSPFLLRSAFLRQETAWNEHGTRTIKSSFIFISISLRCDFFAIFANLSIK